MSSGGPGNVFNADCPSRAVMEQLSEKWSLLILHLLAEGPQRTSDLRRAIGGVSEKMLIQTLRKLERNGFVERRSYNEVPPRVDYRLTDLGRSLVPVVKAFDHWIEARIVDVIAAQRRFDGRQGP
ncbi:MAG: helix-turn-helix transcriptional regulator [Proteobacteria bacterium]|nr:helix-turn-helix transcriptional regulator [Pseudomonadota bacterium]